MATSHQYEQWFRSADKDGSGYLTSKELSKALKAKGYKIGRKQLKEQFKQFDLDGDGKITLQEYLIAMGQVPEVLHKEATLRKAFEKADRNGDGNLDIGELNPIFVEMKKYLNPDEDLH
uniref:Putative calcium binding protein KEY n=1 Tax=Pectinaria gouldii TaxID=260746 RepID=A0A0K1P2X9_PECGU|nr:putative calcium binding protein KEY [Pectinaria gouldii]